jgi:hypothetical protein
VAVILAALLGTSVGCIGGNCSKKPPDVQVVFPGSTPPSAIASFTATGACGPAPASICPASSAAPQCDAALAGPWAVQVPLVGSGACVLHVVLDDGRIYDDSVMVKYASDCGGGYFVDSDAVFVFTSGDAGITE